jgi:RNA polymerase sigma-70 factor (ECF subfamily)
MVVRAAELKDGREALDSLLRKYLGPLKRYVMARWSVDNAAADDLIQAFVAEKILEHEILSMADSRRGKFRSFLLTVLNRFVTNAFRDERRLKRGGGAGVALEGRILESIAAPDADPSTQFDFEWATLVLNRTITQMRGECAELGREDVWGVFEARILGPTLYQRESLPYGELVSRFGLTSPEQASNILVTGKRMFSRCLRCVVGEYSEDEAELNDEVVELRNILARSTGGRGM